MDGLQSRPRIERTRANKLCYYGAETYEGLPEHISLNLIALFSANGLIFTPRRLFIGRNLKDITAQMVVHTQQNGKPAIKLRNFLHARPLQVYFRSVRPMTWAVRINHFEWLL